MKHVHLIGVAGTGMGALAGLLRNAGYRVTGSDIAFYPPMGDKLKEWGVETLRGYDAAHLEPRPDLVVVGNVSRRDNPEARAAIDGGIPYRSMPGALEELFLNERQVFVVSGTHGKTTTTALTTFLLMGETRAPGYLLGGVARDFAESFALGTQSGPFVIEGDEYDSAFFEKQPKFWRYNPYAAIVTSVEHDHIDIYPTPESYRAAFEGFVTRIPEQGLLVAYAGDPEVRALAKQATSRVAFYALQGDDTGDVTPTWLAAPAPAQGGVQPFDLFYGGSASGRVHSPLSGLHNVKNTLAAIALCAEGAGCSVQSLVRRVASFGGVRRRQELVAIADGVRVYDDFAHHPTAVLETLRGLRARHPDGKLIAMFEPRSATASRKLHQEMYATAFEAADLALLAPVGRKEIAAGERLDVDALAAEIAKHGKRALAPADHDAILTLLTHEAQPGDTIVAMSNGDFGGIVNRVVAALTARSLR
ncbi:MAG TPA: Mur ligase family protein [Polyangiales bacterium]|nr:Mur ligase family protein [Polyangiales bacterium]